MEHQISMSIPLDDDGFLSRECPNCARRFKVKHNEEAPTSLQFCPYCGFEGQGCWWTTEQVEYAQVVAMSQVVDPMLGEFARKMNQLNSGLVKVSMKTTPTKVPDPPAETNLPMPIVEFACCRGMIKHDGSQQELKCVSCGSQHAFGTDVPGLSE